MVGMPKHRLAGVLSAVLLASGAAAGSLSADRAIERGFASLIVDGSAAAPRVTDRASENLVAGSEDYWLRQPVRSNSAGRALERVIWRGPVAAGGTLVIGSGASRKELEVIAIEEAAAPTNTRIDMGMTANPPLRVQARDGHNMSAPAMWLELTHNVALPSDASSGTSDAVTHTADGVALETL